MSGLCCCICCGEIVEACTKLVGSRRVTQLTYVALIVFFIVPVVIITQVLTHLSKLINITPSSVVLRMFLCLFIMFVLLFLLMMCRNRVSQVINQGLFCVKFTILVALFVGSLYLPSHIQNIFGEVSKICSIVYSLIQTIILVDIFYLIGIKLVRRYDEGETHCAGVLIGFTIIAESLAIFLNVLAYIKFGGDQCGSTTWVSIITSVILVLLPAVQLLGFNPQNSLLTTSLVSLLVAYLSFSGQQYFGQGCQIRLTPVGYSIQVAICLILFALTTYGTIMGGFSENQYQKVQQRNQQLIKNAMQVKPVQTVVVVDSIKQYQQGWGWIRWHFFMCLEVMYLGMLFSNWQSTDKIGRNLIGSNFVFWVRVAGSWFTALVYIWTLIVPRLFSDRDFRIE